MLQETNSSSMVATSDNMSVLPRLASCQGAITILCGCTVSAALGRRCFWKSLAWRAGLLFGVSCKSLIECIRRNLELAIAFRIFYASKRARSIIKQSMWFDENTLPISLHNTPHPDPNTHIHCHLLDRNELVFQSHNINTHVSFLCLVDANLLSPHTCFLQCSKTCRWWCTNPFHFFYPSDPHFCLSVTFLWVKAKTWSLSIGQVLQYNPVPPMDCWTVRVDLSEANCCWIHSSTAVSARVTHFSASSFLRSCSACICPFALTA
jgi:hypothetical protein